MTCLMPEIWHLHYTQKEIRNGYEIKQAGRVAYSQSLDVVLDRNNINVAGCCLMAAHAADEDAAMTFTMVLIVLIMIGTLAVSIGLYRDVTDQLDQLQKELNCMKEKNKEFCAEFISISKDLNREQMKLRNWVYRYLPDEEEK